MANIVTRGFGNGFLIGSIAEIVGRGYTQAYNIDGDVVPFSFLDQENVALSTVIESNTIVVVSAVGLFDISIVGGEYSVNEAAYTAVDGTVSDGDTVQLRHTSAAVYNAPNERGKVESIVQIGDQYDSFSTFTEFSSAQVPTRAPRTRNTNLRTLSTVFGGPEQKYDVYRFGRKRFYEDPNHNPFD